MFSTTAKSHMAPPSTAELLAGAGQTRCHGMQLLCAHSILGPWGAPLTWMDTAVHDMGSLGHTLQMDVPRDWVYLALDV